jgi:predicted nucleic acid-binding protein
MTGLDCNVLVQLALADHPANAATVAAVQAEAKRTSSLVLPPLVVTEFLHVVTDARRFSPPLTMVEALDWIEEFLANPSVRLLQANEQSLRQTLCWSLPITPSLRHSTTPLCHRPIPIAYQ